MIRFGLRLALAGGREALTRLVLIATAVALGVAMLLAIAAGINAVNAQNARYAWLDTGASSTVDSTMTAPDPLWWSLREDYFDRRPITRVDIAATGPDSPVPPGIPHLPGPGEFYASPALSALLAATPADQLADRYPGRQIGLIARAALLDPGSLVVIIGHTADEMSGMSFAGQVTRIETTPPAERAAVLNLIMSVVAAGLLFPVLILVGTATRLAATRREQRFAAMRLVGATPRQVSLISTVESVTAAIAGTAVGFALYAALHGQLASVPFTGVPFFPDDLSLGVTDVVLVALGVPAGAAIAARIALRRVRISPLGVTRRVTPRAPRAYRLIPLLAGVGELAYFIGRRPDTSDGQTAAFLSGILLIMVGLMIAGPWLTMTGARVLARRSSRTSTLIAARRLADNPRAAFRAVSGLMLALFVTSVATGVITTIVAHLGGQPTPAGTTLASYFWPEEDMAAPMTTVPDAVTADLRAAPGIQSVTVVRRNPAAIPRAETASGARPLPGVVLCADLARAPTQLSCAPGATVAEVWPGLTDFPESYGPASVWPATSLSAQQFQELAVLSVIVGTDGSTAAIERARTVLEVAYPQHTRTPATDADWEAEFVRTLAGWQQLASVVILASLPIAGVSLAASAVGGLTERKRPFSLLRLSGAPVRVLRRVVVLEGAVPLLVVAVVAIAVGLLAAHLFLTAQMGYALRPLGGGYYLTVLIGIVASLGIIASTLPLLERITGPETARNE